LPPIRSTKVTIESQLSKTEKVEWRQPKQLSCLFRPSLR